jgi:hypothetical protein
MRASVRVLASTFVVVSSSLALAPSAAADGCTTSVGAGYTVTCKTNGSSSSYTAPQRSGPSIDLPTVNGVSCAVTNTHLCRALVATGNAVGPVP